MKRWHDEINAMKKQVKIREEAVGDHQPLGRYRKHHAMDCGNPHCCICHYSKVEKLKTHKEEIEEQRAKEEIQEYCENSQL